jgi:TIR domain-containing protein
MAEVFISYARADRDAAQAIAGELEQLGVEVWWDHDLLGGEDYRRKISELLTRTQAAIVIWSRRSVESQWVTSEAAEARDRKVLVPVTIDGEAPPIDFRGIHTTDLMSWMPGDHLPNNLLRSLSERLGRDLSYVEAARRSGAVARLAKRTTQAWYADFESLLFYFIGQGFACFLVNLSLVSLYRSAPGSATSGSGFPDWVVYLFALMNGVIVAALYMRPALESRRMTIAVPLFLLASLLSLASYASATVVWNLGANYAVALVGLATVAMLLFTAIAQRSGRR